mmetsp:Transcript_46140/g.142924  ORF Transcript_46140/g.142924 Transcript_46140/m.142924 type:complete len:302 (+) Transcript_46140:118-1023(+)
MPADESTFQAAVLEQLRAMCGDHEDAKVLAEYIVVMVAGNKGREEMTVELQPFFQAQAQAESFVNWVEECKWKFLTGASPSPPKQHVVAESPPPSPSPTPRSAAGPEVFVQRAPAANVSTSPQRARRPSPAAGSSAAISVSASPSPTASTRSKLSMEAGSVFEVPPLSAVGVAGSRSLAASAPAPRPTARPAAAPATAQVRSSGASSAPLFQRVRTASSLGVSSVSGPASSKATFGASRPHSTHGLRQKQELLKNMTKQLQVILTKLNDKSLNDSMREKYQALAQNIHTQMAKLTPPARRR